MSQRPQTLFMCCAPYLVSMYWKSEKCFGRRKMKYSKRGQKGKYALQEFVYQCICGQNLRRIRFGTVNFQGAEAENC